MNNQPSNLDHMRTITTQAMRITHKTFGQILEYLSLRVGIIKFIVLTDFTINIKLISLIVISVNCNPIKVVAVIQLLSGVIPLAEMAGFTPFLLQLLALRPSTCLVSVHPPSNQSSLSPLPLSSSMSSSVVLAFSCHSF